MSCGDPPVFNTKKYMSDSDVWNILGDERIEKLEGRIKELERRLLIINPNEPLHEKYPSLKEAYDAYEMILKVVGNDVK